MGRSGEVQEVPSADLTTLASFWAVVPAGGAGTRLWPVSRAARPKFLLPLLGSRSLLQATVDRLAPLTQPERTLVVCGPAHAAAIARQLPKLPETNLIVEPSPKGSGPAIGLAAALIAHEDPNAIMGSFAADHLVRDEAALIRAVQVGRVTARGNWLVTIGLTPTHPETGYGYIERTEKLIVIALRTPAYEAARFVEKPDVTTATEYVTSGRFLWNASMFIWRAQALMDEMARWQPELYPGIRQIVDVWDSPHRERIMAQVWATFPETTIDQGIMEHSQRVAVVPADMGWSDVGEWNGLGALLDQDMDGNGTRGTLVQVGARDSVVWSETNRLVAIVGLHGIVVVDTEEALLVADRTKSQDVREVVTLLKQRGLTDLV